MRIKEGKTKTVCSLQSLKFYSLILLEKIPQTYRGVTPEIGVLAKPPSDSDANGLRATRLRVAE